MKHILEYSRYVRSERRSFPIGEDRFVELFMRNCKNFNFRNQQLYRGVTIKDDTDFFYIDPTIRERGYDRHQRMVIKGTPYNTKLRKHPDFKHLPDRSRCVIGSTHPKGAMITVGDMRGVIQEDRTFIIIPFDNIEIAVGPILDLQLLTHAGQNNLFTGDNFQLKKYTKNFTIDGITNEHIVTESREIWTEGECLLVRYSSLNYLKELVKNR